MANTKLLVPGAALASFLVAYLPVMVLLEILELLSMIAFILLTFLLTLSVWMVLVTYVPIPPLMFCLTHGLYLLLLYVVLEIVHMLILSF